MKKLKWTVVMGGDCLHLAQIDEDGPYSQQVKAKCGLTRWALPTLPPLGRPYCERCAKKESPA